MCRAADKMMQHKEGIYHTQNVHVHALGSEKGELCA